MPDFAQLARAFLDEEYAQSPSGASSLGLIEYDDQLEDLSEAAFLRRSQRTDDWLGDFGSLDAASLDFDEMIDRDLAIASLHRRGIFDGWEAWRRHPDTYLNPGLRGVFGLFLHRLRPESKTAQIQERPVGLRTTRGGAVQHNVARPMLESRDLNFRQALAKGEQLP